MPSELVRKLMSMNLPLVILPPDLYEDSEENELLKAMKEKEETAPNVVVPYVT